MKRRLLAILLAIVMLYSAFPASILRAEEGDDLPPLEYVDANDQPLTREDYTILHDEISSLDLTGGWYALQGDQNFRTALNINGNVDLILCDDANIRFYSGIRLAAGASLTIWSQSGHTGWLNRVNGKDGHAGIDVPVGATLTINGGNMNTQGVAGAAGIGGGTFRESGSIIINNGEINAAGGGPSDIGECNGGAGIGGGDRASNGPITINGGVVTAKASGEGGAGIGAGTEADQLCSIIIRGGTVYASAVTGAGIGGGGDGESYLTGTAGNGGTVTISGDTTTVEAKSRYGAGIGGGGASGIVTVTSGSDGGRVTISGKATVTAMTARPASGLR